MAELRVLLRIARRSAARARGRSLLVVGLIALTVGAGVFVATATRTLGVTDQDRRDAELGGADLAFAANRGERDAIDEIRAVSEERGDRVSVYTSTEFERVWGEEVLFSLDLDDPLTDGILDLRAGRSPIADDEVAITPELMELNEVEIGDRVEIPFTGGSWLVVGEIAHPFNGDYRAAVMTDEGFESTGRTGRTTALVGGERVADERIEYLGITGGWWNGRHIELGVDDPGIDLSQPQQLSTAVSLLLVLEAATVGGAVFAVGTRRRLREFGQLAVVGATGRQLRRLVLAESIVLAGLGTVVGSLVGFGSFLATSSTLADLARRTPTSVEWSLIDLVGPILAGTLAAVIAAWWPARRVGNIEPVRALAGRFDTAPFSPKLAGAGAVLIVTGLLAFGAVLGTDSTTDLAGVALVAALVIVFIGTAVCAGPLVTLAGRGASILSGLPRLVVRDSGRQPVRAGASIAALLLVVGVPVLVGTIAASDQWSDNESWTDRDVVVINDLASLDERTIAASSGTLPGVVATAASVDLGPLAIDALSAHSEVLGVAELRSGLASSSGEAGIFVRPRVTVADDDVVGLLGFDGSARAALAGGDVVAGQLSFAIFAAGGPSTPVEVVPIGDDVLRIGARLPEGRNGYPLPSVWVSSETAAGLDVEFEPAGKLVRLRDPLSSAQLERVRLDFIDALFEQGVAPTDAVNVMLNTFSTGGPPNGLSRAEIVTVVLVGALALALLIGAAGAALSAVELDQELGTLVAIGAAPSIRRRFVGLQSGYHVLIAAVLASPIAVAVVWVTYESEEFSRDVSVHRWVLLAVVVGLPLVVGGVMALLFRSGRPTVSRRLS